MTFFEANCEGTARSWDSRHGSAGAGGSLFKHAAQTILLPRMLQANSFEDIQIFEIAPPVVEWLDSAGLIALNQCCRHARSLSELQVAELRHAGWENFLPRALAFRRLAGLR